MASVSCTWRKGVNAWQARVNAWEARVARGKRELTRGKRELRVATGSYDCRFLVERTDETFSLKFGD